jgi:Sigma-70 region 2
MPEPKFDLANAGSSSVGAEVGTDGMRESASDELLVRAMASGDAQALGVLYDRWVDLLYDRAVRMGRSSVDAEALVESAFWEAWLHADCYATTCGRPGQWLFNLMTDMSADGGRFRICGPARGAHRV